MLIEVTFGGPSVTGTYTQESIQNFLAYSPRGYTHLASILNELLLEEVLGNTSVALAGTIAEGGFSSTYLLTGLWMTRQASPQTQKK